MKKRRAAEAYARLLALDLTTPERAELTAAGVSRQRIRALYRLEGFSSLTPHLIKHLHAVPNAALVSHSGVQLRHVVALRASLPEDMLESAAIDLDDAQASGLAADFPLENYLRACLAGSLFDPLEATAMKERAVLISEAIWWAHWTMPWREQLPLESQKAVDKLMLAVARTIAL